MSKTIEEAAKDYAYDIGDSDWERVVCRLAPKSLTADLVRLRLAMLHFRREIKRVIDNHVKLD